LRAVSSFSAKKLILSCISMSTNKQPQHQVRPLPCYDASVEFGDDAEIARHFNEHGFVVVSNVLAEDEVNAAVEELWTSPTLLGRNSAVSRDNPSSWTTEFWPQQDGGKNFLESVDAFQDRSCWSLAGNPRVTHVFDLLLQQRGVDSGAFLAKAPRWGVMRPTGRHPQWRTLESWLHWDQNPWSQPGFAGVQGFACLAPQTRTSGGFLCVPGFHKRWRQWGEENPEGTVCVDGRWITRDFGAYNPFPVPADDPLQRQVTRILAPKGSLLVWDSRLPHQNYPNTSDSEFRIILYLHFEAFSEELVSNRRDFLRRRAAVLCALNSEGWWPRGLSEHARQSAGAPDQATMFELQTMLQEKPDLVEAIRMTHQAGELELRGELESSVSMLRAALRRWPDIEAWHDVIFV